MRVSAGGNRLSEKKPVGSTCTFLKYGQGDGNACYIQPDTSYRIATKLIQTLFGSAFQRSETSNV